MGRALRLQAQGASINSQLRHRTFCPFQYQHAFSAATPTRTLQSHRPASRRPVPLSPGRRHKTLKAAGFNQAAVPSPGGTVPWKKYLGLSLVFLGATINHTILDSMKDGLLVTSCGAEALPFISAVGVFPATLAFFIFYDKLARSPSPERVFHYALAPLILFYAVFAAVVLPNVAWLHPTEYFAGLAVNLPDSVSCFVKVVANWSYALFYIVSELWGMVAISLLFWTLADDLCTVAEAKSVYPRLGILANVGLVAAGAFTQFVTEWAAGRDVLGLQLLLAAVCVCGVAMCAVKSYMDGGLNGEGPEAQPHKHRKKESKESSKEEGKEKLDAWAVINSSARVRDLATLVCCYSITKKLFSTVWKGAMKSQYPTASEFTKLMGEVSTYTGWITIGLMLSSKLVFKYLGWGGAALVTPVVAGCGGLLFLVACLLGSGSPPEAAALSGALLTIGPAAGLLTQVFGRASKYSLFDPSKEMVFILMDQREKVAGKAAVDLLGQQIGKSGASWLMQAALLLCGSITAAMPLMAAVYGVTVVAWFRSTLSLSSMMRTAEEQRVVLQTLDEAPDVAMLTPAVTSLLAEEVPANGNGNGRAGGLSIDTEEEEFLRENERLVKASMQSHFE